MAKAVTYEEVAEKAELLVQKNVNPSIKAVQAALGGRSTTDIGRYMKKWHEAKLAMLQKSWRMPDSISAAVDLEIGRRTAEIEARANEGRALASQKTDELFDEVGKMHEDERKAWASERVQLQTDAEIGRRNSAETAQLCTQVHQLELDLQTRTIQFEASVQKIKGLEDLAALVQKIHEQMRTVEINAEIQRKLLEEFKELHRTDRRTWDEEMIQLKSDAEAGRRDSGKNVQLCEQLVKLESDVQDFQNRFDMMAEGQEALMLTAASSQESENRMRVAEACVKALKKELNHFKVQAETHAKMLAPFLDQMEANSEEPMPNTAGYIPIPATFNSTTQAKPADLQNG